MWGKIEEQYKEKWKFKSMAMCTIKNATKYIKWKL
jgi:hypothetical protein